MATKEQIIGALAMCRSPHADLAKAVGVAQSTISRYFRQENADIRAGTKERIEAFLRSRGAVFGEDGSVRIEERKDG